MNAPRCERCGERISGKAQAGFRTIFNDPEPSMRKNWMALITISEVTQKSPTICTECCEALILESFQAAKRCLEKEKETA